MSSNVDFQFLFKSIDKTLEPCYHGSIDVNVILYIAMKFGADIQVPLRMNCMNFGFHYCPMNPTDPK